MTVELVRDIAGEVLKTVLMVAGPVLVVSLVVGLLVSLFQAVTQIQEFTLVFVPKVVAVFLCIFLLIPWMARVLISFTVNLMDKIPQMVR